MKSLRSFVLIFLFCIPPLAPSMDPGLFPPVRGWTCTPGDKVYTPDNLWDLIDGAAELYLSYGFVDLTLADYSNHAGIDVRVELYRHSSTVNAFGMYCQERNSDYHFINVGTQGYIENGVLNFLCGAYYVKITTHRPGKQGRDAMTLIAGKIVEFLRQDSAWPAALALLPAEGKHHDSEAYIAENFLGYSFLHSAYVADYGDKENVQAFIIELSNGEQAQRMASAYLKETHQEGNPVKDGKFRIQDPNVGTVYLLLHGRYLCGVVHCGVEKTAESLLQVIQARLK